MIALFISLVLIILFHEVGHLIVAKKCGCNVLKYSIGFGRPILFSKTLGGTIYQITPWIFLGGYVKLKGELEYSSEKDSFINMPYRKKLAILGAGCAINMIMGAIALIVGLKLQNKNIFYFGYLSFILGVFNWFLPIPCLDGGYAMWYLILTKLFGNIKGTTIFAYATRISFIIIMILNIMCIPLLIRLIQLGRL